MVGYWNIYESIEGSSFIESVQTNQGYLIACLEEISLRNGWINESDIESIIPQYENTEYGNYLKSLI